MIWLQTKPSYFAAKVWSSQANAPVETCEPICAILCEKQEKYPTQGIRSLNRGFQRKTFPTMIYLSHAQILRRIKQRKERYFI